MTSDKRLSGITFSKQFPSSVEPLRGTFVAEQVLATRSCVEWGVIAPAPWVPRVLAPILKRPFVKGGDTFEGIRVERPRYPVLPRRLLYTCVAPMMAEFSAPAFRRMTGDLSPAFVHAHGIYPSGSAARRLCESTDIPLVLSVHGSDLYTNLTRTSWANEVRRTVASAAAVVCVSKSLARDVMALAGADPRRVTVVPNTFDTARFRLLTRQRSEGLRLVSVGRLVPEKGFEVLLGAVARLTESGVDVSLILVGTGPEHAALRLRARELGIEAHVRLLGSQSGDELVSCLRDADMFVSSSKREGFGVAILEALATGLPVVATRVGGPEDLVGPEDGVLVPGGDETALAEGIRALWRRADSLDPASISARAHAVFNPEAIAVRLCEVYHRVAAANPAGRDV
ncbi:MAG: glycosyltransferase [Coriobacteriia bacterium]|nr:glycosyltransferase [Coriobacteriia bacterium]